MHIAWSSLRRHILRCLHTHWLHASWNLIVNLRLVRHHLVLLVMLPLRHHHGLNELNLLLPRLAIHMLWVHSLHLERLSILVKVIRNWHSILLNLAIRMLWPSLIHNLDCLLWHTSSIALPQYLLRMVQNLLLKWLNWLLRITNNSCSWLNDFCLVDIRLLLINCNT